MNGETNRIRLRAIIRDGLIQVNEPVNLPDGTRIQITIDLAEGNAAGTLMAAAGETGATVAGRWGRLRTLQMPRVFSRILTLEAVLFVLALAVYTFTRLWALDRFPIYFFTDEAIHPVIGGDLIRHGLRDFEGTFLPGYFKNDALWNLSLSVYIHAITSTLFGKSIFVTRATSALISVMGVAAVGLTLKRIFANRFWWAGILFLAITPAWFLHSRTAFETALMVSFYACFLLFYLLYRTSSPRYLFPALLFGAATFYAYANGQAIMAVAGLLLLFSDIRYHIRNWRIVVLGVIFLAILAVPYVRFRLTHPEAIQFQLRMLDSYWFRAIPLGDKLVRFRDTYLYGISPQYWFFPNSQDLARHVMKGYPHIPLELLPLALIGLGVSLWRFRSPAHRAVIIACVAAPIGAATVDVGITRVLAFVIPATILTCLGLDWLVARVLPRLPIRVVSVVLASVLSLAALWMLRDAVVNGPLWSRDYGLYGMQWGARPLFTDIIPGYLRRDPNIRLMVSPTWANGTDMLTRFFIREDAWPRIQMLNVDHFLSEKQPLDENMLHVMPRVEYERAKTSDKFKSVSVEEILPYPDGTPGFYFVRLAYADNIDALFAAEKEARRRLVEDDVAIGGQRVHVRYSLLDGGRIQDIFDNDPFTLGRVMEANPAVLEMIFPSPRPVSGLAGDFGSMEFALTIKLYAPGSEEPVTYNETYRGLPPDPHIDVSFTGPPEKVSRMRIEILDLHAGDRAKIHIRELTPKE